jgi:hypothetical protein
MTVATTENSPTAARPVEPANDRLSAMLEVAYDWNYRTDRGSLVALYEKAQRTQWLAAERLPWDTDVDLEKPSRPEELEPLYGSDVERRLTPRERVRLRTEISAWSQSQFLHGEQGALLAAAQLVNAVPDTDGKQYAASQVYDEARHVDVFHRYLRDKIGITYPVRVHVKRLDDMVRGDSRWDIKLLGMQIVLEGLALAAFGLQRDITSEPLLKALTNLVILDEARHVAFGVTLLQEYYAQLPESELREREDLVYEFACLMRDRFLFQEVWDKLGLPAEECIAITLRSERQKRFRNLLFSKVVPAIKRVGLLSPRLRERFQELGILHFEAGQDPMQTFRDAHNELMAATAPNAKS